MELNPDEYAPYYAQYIQSIQSDIATEMKLQFRSLPSFLLNIPKGKEMYRYAPGKWTVKETIGHITDTERVMAYRALCIARNDTTHFPGFAQNDYVAAGNANAREMDELVNDFEVMRISNISLFNSLEEADLLKTGFASGYKVSVRALFCIIVGHAKHHKRILKERYLI
jgi:hypothetical protein